MVVRVLITQNLYLHWDHRVYLGDSAGCISDVNEDIEEFSLVVSLVTAVLTEIGVSGELLDRSEDEKLDILSLVGSLGLEI